jgi:hypothetical protein
MNLTDSHIIIVNIFQSLKKYVYLNILSQNLGSLYKLIINKLLLN